VSMQAQINDLLQIMMKLEVEPIRRKQIMKRIAVAGFQHETNTFASTLAGYAEFEEADAWPGLLVGNDVIRGLTGTAMRLFRCYGVQLNHVLM